MFSIAIIAFTYGTFKQNNVDTVSQGIVGDTVYVNDLDSDYNYYIGKNYTDSSNGQLPSLDNKNNYNTTNMAKVTITYSGVDVNDSSKIGYVSLTEMQDKYVYYKYYPVENGYINIELIDNPFTNRPSDMVFNNWVTDYSGASVSYDSNYYTRSVKIPVTYTNGIPNDIDINFNASWVKGKIYQMTSTSWNNAFASLNAVGMNQIANGDAIYEDMSNYYISGGTVDYWNNYPDNSYDEYGDLASGNTCWDYNGCPYYVKASAQYVEGTTYYELSNNSFSVHTPVITGYSGGTETSNYSSAGLYRQKTVAFQGDMTGLYDASGNIQSGTCYTWGGCSLYEQIQYYDDSGNKNLMNNNEVYYYLTTRDTNIIVLRTNVSSAWSSSNNKPFTLTSVDSGNDYTNYRFNVNNISVKCYADTVLENLYIYTTSSLATSDYPVQGNSYGGNSRYFYGNWHNVKIGRGLKNYNNRANFLAIVGGGNNGTGSYNSPTKYKLTVESGRYNSGALTDGYVGSSYTVYTNARGVYGSDYDRATGNNASLVFNACLAGSWGGEIKSTNNTDAIFDSVYKSGSYGANKSDNVQGIYVGGRHSGDTYALRRGKIEGGWFYNVIGGPLSDSSMASYNDLYLYITGGEITTVVGGAGRSATYGNRIIQMTGGVVDNSVFGGSNGSEGTDGDGTVNGSSYVYIGGSSVVGSESNVTNNYTLFGAESGSVFGIGNGRSGYSGIGSSDNSNVIIDGNALIRRNVYGGGNFGATGYSSQSNSNTTNIHILNGTINGSVYGGGNNNGAGTSSKTATVNLNMTGGTVVGSIYGGSRTNGTIYGSTNVNVLGGSVASVYGGGEGSATYVAQNVTVNAGEAGRDLTVTDSIYGGSAYGVVGGTTKTDTAGSYPVVVNVNNGTINRVFGGGKGDSSNTPYVIGDTTVTINGGKITDVYGGNDASGKPNGTVKVYLKGGTITNAYGGGNNTLVTTSNVYQENSTVTNIFGGSNSSGDVTTSNVTVSGGVTSNLYGGNNVGGTVKTANVTMTNGTVTKVYGGGKLTDTNITNVLINGGTATEVYGGGEQASITDHTDVTVNGGTATTVYGGSNVLGNVEKSTVDINGGTITDVYGGNNQGGLTTTTQVNLNGSTLNNAYGGGNQTTTTTSNVKLNGSTVANIFGGGNEAGVTTTNVSLVTGTATSVYGGSNSSGNVTTSNVVSNSPSNLTVTNVYGGNNQGGVTATANVKLNGGTYVNIYGGGNLTATDNTVVNVQNATVTNQFFGGGNQAGINYNTDVTLTGSTIAGDLFGGGNLGTVAGNTKVYISNSHISNSVYAGGNGVSAIVSGTTELNIDNNSIIDKHVFGGGNAANTGTKEVNNSISNVNIAGATVHGNVYGGANTAVLYGKANLKIGAKATGLTKSNIQIDGTVFGGGEANASGNPNYDYSFISVTKGIDIDIDADGYENFVISGSIFGSGNASSTSGVSNIEIDNYGTFDKYKQNISLQRANTVTIKNSAIEFTGTTDRTNEFSTTKFGISRVKELKLSNNSTLFLQNGANLLEKLSSLTIDGTTETKATVTIDDNGQTTRNVNNRIYMLEGKNLNIATNEAITSYGEVSGMTFFGMYQLDRNGKVLTDFYNNKYSNGDTVASGELYAFTSGSYVLGKHNTNHDITKDGFYSNFENKDVAGTIKTKYIEPTPSDASYYMWVIGEKVTTYDVSLTASKYSTLGTYELPMVTSSDPNTRFEILGFNYQNLEDGFTLISKDSVPRVNMNNQADNQMALVMESSDTGFVTSGSTNFLTSETTPIVGTKNYKSENSTAVPSFLFYLYHSKNLTQQREMGTVVISMVAITPVDELNSKVTRININVTLSEALFNNVDYEGAMTTGEKYGLFASTATNITNKSMLSAYYSLYLNSDNPYYQTGYHHALVSSYVLPKNTKITMIDLVNGPTYYYYVINDADVTRATSEYNLYGECSYNLSKFIAMGSTSSNNNYNEDNDNQNYYNSSLKLVQEEYVFNVDFGNTSISGNQLNNTLLMELRNQNDQTLLGVLGIQHADLTYNLYDNENATLTTVATLDKSTIYSGDKVNLDLTINFNQPVIGTLPVVDTTYYDKRMGAKITVYDSQGNQLNNSTLLGLSYELDGVKYYPRMDGSTRIPLADKIANVYSRLKIDTSNVSLASGSYKFKIETFGSDDGVYFGPTPSNTIEVPFTMVNSRYGLKADLTDSEMIIDKTTGLTQKGTNELNFNMTYSSNLTSPNIRVSLYRRDYTNVYDTNYNIVKLSDYITNELPVGGENIYVFIATPTGNEKKSLYLKTNLKSGTYKFVFTLYDGDVAIGNCEKYVIIK
jgi:hypothetical protein